MIERCKGCGKISTTDNYKNFDLVNDLQWLRQVAKVKQVQEPQQREKSEDATPVQNR